MVEKSNTESNAIQNSNEAVGSFANVVIRASAGTGKTFQLSNRYLKLLAAGSDCQEILATTFTKKGAGEILDRIIQRLARAALSSEHASQLAGELEIALDQSRAQTVLQTLLRSMHRMEISTLDSFFNRVARVFSLELGLPPVWDIVEEQQIDMLRRRTIHEILRNEDVVNLLPLLVKGESSRKIASLIMDTVLRMYDVRRESKPEAWDCLEQPKTFLSDDALAALTDTVVNMTFAKGKQIPNHWKDVVTPIFEDENWSALVELTMFQNVLDGNLKYGRSNLPPEIVTVLEAIIPHCRAHVVHRLIQQNTATCQLLGLFGEGLEQKKGELGQLRFEDVTDRLVEFVSMWNTDQFSFRLDNQIKHLLLDEFQDTSPAQWDVIRPFAQNVCDASNVNDSLRSFFCVGDMKQAIYGWRGGVAEIFDVVENNLTGLAQAQPLTTSYRSSQPIIDVVNDVFLNLKDFCSDSDVVNRGVHAWSAWYSKHSTAKSELKGHVTIEYAAECDESIVKSNKVSLKNALRNDNVLSATVERVRGLNENLPADKSIGILVRTNREIGELIFELQQNGIPASEEGGNPLTDSAAVSLILSALTLADHPGDSIARFHVSHSPLATMFGLQAETQETQAANGIAATTGAASLRERLVQNGYGPTIESLARMLSPSCTKRELIRLQHLVRLAYANRSDTQRWSLRPSRFVEYIRDEVKIADASSARVRVMTIHKSKGLEFDAVVYPHFFSNSGMTGRVKPLIVGRPSPTEEIDTVCRYANKFDRKLLPDSIQDLFEQDQEQSVHEAMCVLYVAMTRAAHSLHVVLSCSDKPNNKSAAGVLLALLCPEAKRDEGVIYETGDSQWYAAAAVDPSEQDEPIASEKIQQYYSRAVSSESFRPLIRKPKSRRGISRVRPSQLEGGTKVRLSDTLTSPERERTMEFGSLLHACFEQIEWLDQGDAVTDDELKLRLNRVVPGSDQLGDVIKRFRELLKFENLKTLLSAQAVGERFVIPDLQFDEASADAANRLEVHCEKRLAVLLNQFANVAVVGSSEIGSIVEGIVDRLVLVYQDNQVVAAEIIDFKIDRIDDANLTERIQFYRPQLAAYQTAVAAMFGLSTSSISSRLVFVQSGQVIQMEFQDHDVDGATDLKLPRKKPPKSASKVAVPKPILKPKSVSEPSATQKTLWSDDADDSIR